MQDFLQIIPAVSAYPDILRPAAAFFDGIHPSTGFRSAAKSSVFSNYFLSSILSTFCSTGSHKFYNNFLLQKVIHIIHKVFHTINSQYFQCFPRFSTDVSSGRKPVSHIVRSAKSLT